MDSQYRTPAYTSPDDILGTIAARCAIHGPVRSVGLFCRSDQPDQLLCMVQMDSGAQAAAAAFPRAFVTGDDVCTFVPVAVEFSCANRSEGSMAVPTCNECRRRS